MNPMWIVAMACIVVVLLAALLGFAVRRADRRIDDMTRRRDREAARHLRDKVAPPW